MSLLTPVMSQPLSVRVALLPTLCCMLGLLVWPCPASAQVGAKLEALQKGEFFRFFNLREVKREPLDDGRILVALEPGSFQQALDLSLTLDKVGRVESATLFAERGWLSPGSTLNPMGKDFIKSFIIALACPADRASILPLTEAIWRVGQEEQTQPSANTAPPNSAMVPIAQALPVVLGKAPAFSQTMAACALDLANGPRAGGIWFSVRLGTPQSAAVMKASAGVAVALDGLFLTAEDLAPWGLKLTQDAIDKNLKAWTNEAANAAVTRVVDIRLSFGSPDEARRYHRQHLVENAEGSREVDAKGILAFGDELHVFNRGPDDPLVTAFGLKLNMYIFLFCRGPVLAKVFVSGPSELSVAQAALVARLADERLRQTLAGGGK